MRRPLPHVYVGIVTYKSAALMTKCVKAILGQTYSAVTVVVFDNNSNDDIEKVLRKFKGRVTFFKNAQNIGYGSGHNRIIQSLKMRKEDYYMSINPDAILDRTCVESLVSTCELHKADWGTGRLYKDVNARVLYSVGHALLRDGYAYNIGHNQVDTGEFDGIREVFGAAGAAAIYKATMIRTVSIGNNFFDPKLFMYYEDVDVDWRARLLGLHCWYVPNAIIYHKGGTFPRYLEAGVLVNRFHSVLKNAFYVDLLLYNIPWMIVHITLRLILTPSVGAQLLLGTTKSLLYVFTHRSRALVSRQKMNSWFMASIEEKSETPKFLKDRVKSFFKRKYSID